MFCCTLLYVHSSIAIILMGKRKLVALLYLSSWCLVMVERLFLAVPWGCLRFVIVVFPDHAHFFYSIVWCESVRTIIYLLKLFTINAQRMNFEKRKNISLVCSIKRFYLIFQ